MPASNDPVSLPQRFDEYAQTAEGIVLRGIEHPSCELKRTLSLDRGDLGDRLDFIKLMQGLANSHADTECLIIVGADQKGSRFFNVENADDFDPARISPIVAKYLSPEPKYEIFNNMRAPGGERYVLIVMNRVQHRPVVTLVDGEAQGKLRFRPGDIWVTENTRLRPATREDLDRMYEPRIEQEAAKRARIIFEHMKTELGPELLSQAVLATPTPELLLGSRERLARFAQAMISSGDPSRFKMLLEMARQILVEKWGLLLERGSRTPYRTNVWHYPGIGSFGRSTSEGNLLELHPTVKPVALVADAILDCSARGEIVLDPFLGSGSTVIAAERTGRICYGMEIDPRYVDTIVRRWQTFTGKSAVQEASGCSFREMEETPHGR